MKPKLGTTCCLLIPSLGGFQDNTKPFLHPAQLPTWGHMLVGGSQRRQRQLEDVGQTGILESFIRGSVAKGFYLCKQLSFPDNTENTRIGLMHLKEPPNRYGNMKFPCIVGKLQSVLQKQMATAIQVSLVNPVTIYRHTHTFKFSVPPAAGREECTKRFTISFFRSVQ